MERMYSGVRYCFPIEPFLLGSGEIWDWYGVVFESALQSEHKDGVYPWYT